MSCFTFKLVIICARVGQKPGFCPKCPVKRHQPLKNPVSWLFVRSGLYPYNLTVSRCANQTARKIGCHRTVRQTAKASQKVHCQSLIILNPVASELILPKVRTRQCRVPTINRGRDTALPSPLYHSHASQDTAVPCPYN